MLHMKDLRRIVTGVKLTQADILESQLMAVKARNEARTRVMARSLGSRYLLSPEYDGSYVPVLTKKAAA